MLDLGQVLKQGLTFAKSAKQSLVLVEVPSVLLSLVTLDSDAPEQAEGKPEHPGHTAKKADLLGGERLAGSRDQERSPDLPVHADGDCLAPPGTRDQDTGLFAAGRRKYLRAGMSPGPPARSLYPGLPQEGAGVGPERVSQAFEAVVERR